MTELNPNSPHFQSRFDAEVASVWAEIESLIPQDFKSHFAQIQFLIEDEPSEELLQDLDEEIQDDPTLLCGLYVGTPITQASVISPDTQPSRVYLFRKGLWSLVENEESDPVEALREEIAVTLLHEIGHFFGLDEEDLERLGYD